jgi:PAS domain S-box-containing protein
LTDSAETRKKMLKEIITQLHAGASPQEVKEKFKQVLEGTTAEDVAKIEQELVKEGMPREELQRLCDVHLAVFGEQLEKQEMQIPLGHPISILMEEHKILLRHSERLAIVTDKIEQARALVHVSDALPELEHIAKDFLDAEKHYLREENVLFPIMEKHGITEPPAIMWMEHNQIREKKKQLHDLVEKSNTVNFEDFKKQLGEVAKPLCDILPSHFFKENSILFPTALQVVTSEEWEGARREFDEIGYCCFTPANLTRATKPEEAEKPRAEAASAPEGTLRFETGSLSKEEVEAILDSLPVDISFVDRNDEVKYFNRADKRIFVRTKAVIGRTVQMCHPQKSVHMVNKIVEAFKAEKKDVAEFWITMNDRLIHIRYFAVRDKNRKYLGTMEVAQDLTDIKKIEGQKRLLDWEQ